MKQLNDLENLKNVLLMEYISNVAQQNERLAEENKTLLEALKISDKKNEPLQKELENTKELLQKSMDSLKETEEAYMDSLKETEKAYNNVFIQKDKIIHELKINISGNEHYQDLLRENSKEQEQVIENLKAENNLLKNEFEKLSNLYKLELDNKQGSIDSLEERLEKRGF